ncbi:hypothetical protein [Marmoricola sp. RAF53]|uniref:hypothetical protein n=1 Tax=Marmoricola sp. RAF53 TaxID=3233059 RepID=UPI003F9ABE24
MQVTPVRLNAAIAWLFMVGSALFAVGSVPAYANAVGGPLDALTYFVGSLFFTSASYCQLVQAQSPGTVGVDAAGQHRAVPLRFRGWLPHDRGWMAAVTQFPGTLFFNVSTAAVLVVNATAAAEDRHVWRPDFFGSVLFLVASTYAVLALGAGFLGVRPRSLPWWIAWLNMLGSVFFMWSALASYVLPSTDDYLDARASVGGTLLGALCFLLGAALMLPAWRRDVSARCR